MTGTAWSALSGPMMSAPPPTPPPLDPTTAGLSRLAHAHAARIVADFARGLVPAEPGGPGYGGLLVADAVALLTLADAVLTAAVLAERDAGTGWDEIADGAATDPAAAGARWEPALQQWHADLAVASSRLGGRPLDDADLPGVLAAPPTLVARELDQWVERHRQPDDPVIDHTLTDAVTGRPAGR